MNFKVFIIPTQNAKRSTVNPPLHQQIREKYGLGPAMHMTHIENLENVLRSGGILSYNRMKGLLYQNLSNEDVQLGRSQIIIPATGRPLHDYVPLYFGFKTPMVAYNQKINSELIFLRASLDILTIQGVVISDGNARSRKTSFAIFKTMDDLACLDCKAIQSVKYAGDVELKRRKQAELLIPDTLEWLNIYDIIVFSDLTKKRVVAILNSFGKHKSVRSNPGWYFITSEKSPS